MTNKIGTSPAYLFRNSYSYYFRIKVPKDLQYLVGKRELRCSLKTGYLGIAKQKARYLAGNVQWLFDVLRNNGVVMNKLTESQIQQLINRYIWNKL